MRIYDVPVHFTSLIKVSDDAMVLPSPCFYMFIACYGVYLWNWARGKMQTPQIRFQDLSATSQQAKRSKSLQLQLIKSETSSHEVHSITLKEHDIAESSQLSASIILKNKSTNMHSF